MWITGSEFSNTLAQTYEELIHLTDPMMEVAMAIGGLGALLFVSKHVFHALAHGEAIDIYPLLRPFTIGICILLFPYLVLGTIDSIMEPICSVTEGLGVDKVEEMERLKEECRIKQSAVHIKNEKPYRLSPDEYQKAQELVFNNRVDLEDAKDETDVPFSPTAFGEILSDKLEALIDKGVRDLCDLVLTCFTMGIEFMSVFMRLVLSVIGPIVFAISIFTGLESGLQMWISRYITFWLWIPVGNILKSFLAGINMVMIKNDIASLDQVLASNDFGNIEFSDSMMIVFYVFAAAGFAAIPTIAGWIVEAGGGAGALGSAIKSGLFGTAKGVGGKASKFIGKHPPSFTKFNPQKTQQKTQK